MSITWGRRLVAAAATGIFVATLVGCGNASEQPVTITFNQNKVEAAAYFDEVIEQFEAENPDVHVVQDPHEDRFVPALVRGTPPDVKAGGWTAIQAAFAKQDVFKDLSDLPIVAGIDDSAIELVRQWGAHDDDALVALPYSLVGVGVIYNKDIFAAHGLEVPTTWDEFTSICDTLAAAGVTPVYGTFREGWTLEMPTDYVMGDFSEHYEALRTQGPTLTAESSASFENTLGAQLPKFDFILDQAEAGAAAQGYMDGNQAFGQGAAAMYFQGPWALTEIVRVNPDIHLGTFALPTTNDPADTKARIILDLVLSIPKDAPHPEEAGRFIEFLFRDDVIAQYNAQNGGFSPLKDAQQAEDERLDGLLPYVQDGRVYLGMSAYFDGGIQRGNFYQQYALGRNPDTLLSTLTEQWRLTAQRALLRGTY